MVFSFLHSRKGKVFSSNEQSKIDRICRNIKILNKKKFTINFSVEENRDYGSTIVNEGHRSLSVTASVNDIIGKKYTKNLVTQTMSYKYIFSDNIINLSVNKIFPTNKDEAKEIFRINNKTIQNEKIDYKNTSGITVSATSETIKKWTGINTIQESSPDDISCILINNNIRWEKDLEKDINNIFKVANKMIT